MRKTPAPNGRFGEMAALAPQKRQCELGSYYPAGSSVKPPPRKAAWTLCAIGESALHHRFTDTYNNERQDTREAVRAGRI